MKNTVYEFLCFILIIDQGNGKKSQYFTRKPKDIIAKAGENVVLPCRVGEVPGLVQWAKDGFALGDSRDLPGYSRYQYVGFQTTVWDLQISGVAMSDDALYQCQVGGSMQVDPIVSDPVRLTVYVETTKPQILQGEEVEVVEGREEELQCMAEGRPRPELEWRDGNGDLLQVNEELKSMKLYDTKTFRTISMIKIIPRKDQDKQNISCISTNSVASDFKSSQVTLKLLYKPEIKVTQSNTNGVEKPGDTVQFNCFSKATPRVTDIEWFLNDEKLPDESRDMLLLKTGSTDMNGARIKCVARNTIGSAADEIKIQLKSGPLITLHPTSQSVKEGDNVMMKCKARGNPKPSYTWTKGSSEQVGTGDTLTLVASSAVAGQYYCHATVEGFPSVASKPASLKIISKPEINISSKIQYGEIGEKSYMNCRVGSLAEKVTIKWEKHGYLIKTENFSMHNKEDDSLTSDLVVDIVDESDFGGFRCIAENEVGTSYKEITLQKREEVSTSTILYVAIGVLFAVILILIASLFIIYYSKTKKPLPEAKTPPTAQNRFGQPDLLNNNDNLLRDLLSTRNKGVDENSRNILHQTNPMSGQAIQPLFPSPPFEISRRSSLLSFFQDTGNEQEAVPTLLNEISIMPSNTPSILSASAADSGVYSPPHSVQFTERESSHRLSGNITVARNHSWKLKEKVNEDDVDDVILTTASFETTV